MTPGRRRDDEAEEDAEGAQPVITEHTRYSGVLVAATIASVLTIASLFYSIKADTASMRTSLEKLDSDKVSRWELTRWTRALQHDNAGNIKVEVYAPEEGAK